MNKWIYNLRYGFFSERSMQFSRKRYLCTSNSREKHREGHCISSPRFQPKGFKSLNLWSDDTWEFFREGLLKYQINIYLIINAHYILSAGLNKQNTEWTMLNWGSWALMDTESVLYFTKYEQNQVIWQNMSSECGL